MATYPLDAQHPLRCIIRWDQEANDDYLSNETLYTTNVAVKGKEIDYHTLERFTMYI